MLTFEAATDELKVYAYNPSKNIAVGPGRVGSSRMSNSCSMLTVLKFLEKLILHISFSNDILFESLSLPHGQMSMQYRSATHHPSVSVLYCVNEI